MSAIEEEPQERQQQVKKEDMNSNESMSQLDLLCGPEKVMTRKSIETCSRIFKDFFLETGKISTFNQLFVDIWTILSREQGEKYGRKDFQWCHRIGKGLNMCSYHPPVASGSTSCYKTKESVIDLVLVTCKRENFGAFDAVDKTTLERFGDGLRNDYTNQRQRKQTDHFAPPTSSKRKADQIDNDRQGNDRQSSKKTTSTRSYKRRTGPTLKDFLFANKCIREDITEVGPVFSCQFCPKKKQKKLNTTLFCEHIVCDCHGGVTEDVKRNLASKTKSRRCEEWLRQNSGHKNDKSDMEEENEVRSMSGASSVFQLSAATPQDQHPRNVQIDTSQSDSSSLCSNAGLNGIGGISGIGGIGVLVQELKGKGQEWVNQSFFYSLLNICVQHLLKHEILNAMQEFSIDFRRQDDEFINNLSRFQSREGRKKLNKHLNEVGLQLKTVKSKSIDLKKMNR